MDRLILFICFCVTADFGGTVDTGRVPPAVPFLRNMLNNRKIADRLFGSSTYLRQLFRETPFQLSDLKARPRLRLRYGSCQLFETSSFILLPSAFLPSPPARQADTNQEDAPIAFGGRGRSFLIR